MATELRLRRGTNTQNDAFTGADGEITVDSTNRKLRLHDGTTPGGHVIGGDAEITLPPGGIVGLVLSNNLTDAANDLNIASGRVRDAYNNKDILLPAGIVKRLDAAWAVGSGAGGLDTGTKAVSSGYHVHAIRRDSDGAGDVLFSTSYASPVLPDGWSTSSPIGWVRTDSSGSILPFDQVGNFFRYKDRAQTEFSGEAFTQYVSKLKALTFVPVGVKILTKFLFFVDHATNSDVAWAILRDPDLGVPTTTPSDFPYQAVVDVPAGSVGRAGIAVDVYTDTTGHVYVADGASGGASIALSVIGFSYPRAGRQ